MKHLRRTLAAATLACALATSAAAGQMGTGFAGGETCGQIDAPPCAEGHMDTPQADGTIHTGVTGQIDVPPAPNGQVEVPPRADGWMGTGLSLLGSVLGLF